MESDVNSISPTHSSDPTTTNIIHSVQEIPSITAQTKQDPILNPFFAGSNESHTNKQFLHIELTSLQQIPERKSGKKVVPGSPDYVLTQKLINKLKGNSVLYQQSNSVEIKSGNGKKTPHAYISSSIVPAENENADNFGWFFNHMKASQ